MNLPLKVLFITYYWPPSGGAGVQRCLKFVKHLPSFGVTPAVVTVSEKEGSFPVFDYSLEKDIPEGIQVYRTSTTEPFEAYRKLTSKKEIPYSGFANEGKPGALQKVLRFVRGNFFIPDARVGWNRHALKKCRELLHAERFDVIFTSSPPHSSQLIGLQLKKEFPQVKWIADLRDPWTDIFYNKELSQTALAKALDKKYEKQVLQGADLVLVTSNDTRDLFLKKGYGLKVEHVAVITNGYDDDDFNYPSEPPADTFCITYTGTLTEAYKLETFFKALRQVKQNYPLLPLKLRLVGKVSHGVMQQLEKAELLAVTELVPYVPHNESVRYLLKSTVLFLAFAEAPALLSNIPGKLFEYLASGKEIMAVGAVNSTTDQILSETKAGKLFDYHDLQGQINHLSELYTRWLHNPNVDRAGTLHQKYSRKELTGQLAIFLKKLTSQSSSY